MVDPDQDFYFLYLGASQQAWGYVHAFWRSHSGKEKQSVIDASCVNVYDVLIREQLIQKNEKMIVYNALPSNEIEAVAVDHNDFQHTVFSPVELKCILFRLAAHDHTEEGSSIIVKRASHAVSRGSPCCCYVLYKLDGTCNKFNELKKLTMENTLLEKLRTAYSFKTLYYLHPFYALK
jgi:hypothetical protein